LWYDDDFLKIFYSVQPNHGGTFFTARWLYCTFAVSFLSFFLIILSHVDLVVLCWSPKILHVGHQYISLHIPKICLTMFFWNILVFGTSRNSSSSNIFHYLIKLYMKKDNVVTSFSSSCQDVCLGKSHYMGLFLPYWWLPQVE